METEIGRVKLNFIAGGVSDEGSFGACPSNLMDSSRSIVSLVPSQNCCSPTL